MALVAVWINTDPGSVYGWERWLIDPSQHKDAKTDSERVWRIKTGGTHEEYRRAHAQALSVLAERCLEAIKPPRHLQLGWDRRKAQERDNAEEWRIYNEKIAAWRVRQDRADMLGLMRRIRRVEIKEEGALATLTEFALQQGDDHDFITAMFTLYAQGRVRLL